MTLQEKEATLENGAAAQNCGLCGRADPNVKPPDLLIPSVGSVDSWKVVRTLTSRGSQRPHSFIVKRGSFTTRIHHSQLLVDSESIELNASLDLLTVGFDSFDREKPRAVVSQKGAFYASQKGKTVTGVVTAVAKYGVFVSSTDLPFCLKGLVHRSKLAGFDKSGALKKLRKGDAIIFRVEDFKPHPDSAKRIAGDWQVDCSQERPVYAEAHRLLKDARADSNCMCATATVVGRGHRHESFLVEMTLPTGGVFVARLTPPATAIYKGDRLQVVVDSVDWEAERPGAEVSFVARLP
ncbi:MAG: S1 RNA-binding domain-containing protein [Candidatus Obscuribacterales bacterium]